MNAPHRAHARVRAGAAHDMGAVQARQHRGRLAVDRGRDHEPGLQAGNAPVDQKTRANEQVLVPEDRNDRTVLREQLLEALSTDDALAPGSPDELEESGRNVNGNSIEEEAPGREPPLRFRAANRAGWLQIVR